ncbi:antiviral RADAR system adenosine deaminase RdrB [Vibrio jasicida]|uniref:antiviral RADAR system adenosine deaminase RdrB n=1 Tax=Vibrio jasicida TaxID=766224 RepID=UPI00163EEF5F|nr:antiviral RADAR system adenosine deaminase RdrB [Vibrio jasicida]
MFTVEKRWIAPIVALTSDRLLNFLMSESTTSSPNGFKRCLSLAMQDYSSYSGTRLRKEDIDALLRTWKLDSNEVRVLEILNSLSDYFLIWVGDRFEVKDSKLEEWLRFVSLVDPAYIIAVSYQKMLTNGLLGISQLVQCMHNQCPSALPQRSPNKIFADNHVHINGHGHNSLALTDFALYLTKHEPLAKEYWPYRSECTLFNSEQLDIQKLPLLVNRLLHRLISSVYKEDCDLQGRELSWDSIELEELNDDLLKLVEEKDPNSLVESIIRKVHIGSVAEKNRWLLTVVFVIELLDKSECTAKRRLIHMMLVSSGLLRNHMIVSGVGLGDFVDVFHFKYRKPTDRKNFLNHSINQDASSNICREFRVSPDILIKKKRKKHVLKEKRLVELLENVGKANRNNFHLVIHFTRATPYGSLKEDRYLLEYRETLLRQTRLLQDFSGSPFFQHYSLSNEIESSIEDIVDLRSVIRGFDVAGNENDLPIEIFAPVLRVLRSGQHESTSPFDKRLRNPFLTVHAGEDFSHILSGLRSIDEAVYFCDFKAGDRLGHALALGINVSAWASRQKSAFVTCRQHLDNLVWLKSIALKLLEHSPKFESCLKTLEFKIDAWTNYLYSSYDTKPTFSELLTAWKLRRNCPLYVQDASSFNASERAFWAPDFVELKSKESSVQLWDAYLNTGNTDSGRFMERSAEYVEVALDNQHSEININERIDFMSKAELLLIEAVQDFLIEKYSEKQIVIEACPTSNIYIGRLFKYSEHPIFRFCPPNRQWLENGKMFNKHGIRKGPIKVCVNTDDAGLMPTTIENEHRILKEVAQKYFEVSDFDAENWIQHVRLVGTDTFSLNHLAW